MYNSKKIASNTKSVDRQLAWLLDICHSVGITEHLIEEKATEAVIDLSTEGDQSTIKSELMPPLLDDDNFCASLLDDFEKEAEAYPLFARSENWVYSFWEED